MGGRGAGGGAEAPCLDAIHHHFQAHIEARRAAKQLAVCACARVCH